MRQCRLNPLSSQSSSLRTRVRAEIAALDIDQGRTLAILAGREILQTVRVTGASCAEETNIREEVVRHDRINATRHRDNLEIHDVKWSNGAYSSYIACAATNGKVVIYDLNRPGIEVASFYEHSRQVHKVAFCPHQGGLLLSASQDASVKLWDLRASKSEILNLPRTKTFAGQSEAIRDVRWSPTDVFEFAFGTDNGSIQKWDHRNTKAPKLRILRAHDGGCTSVDWHPDGKHLLSAGKDKLLKVWDFSSDGQPRQKPMSTLKTPYSIANARWRPPCWSEDDYGKGSWQCTQVVTSYDRHYPVVHLWDLRRQYIPYREIFTCKQAPTDMLWHSLDRLWSVGRDGDFFQTDIKYAPKTIDRRPLSTFAISPLGEMVAFSQRRSPRRRSDVDDAVPEIAHPGGLKREPSSLSDRAEMSRSSADDSKEDSFLSTSYQARHHERAMSDRSPRVSIAGTPPALTKVSLTKLNDTLEKTKDMYQPQQVAFRGMLDGAGNVQAFSYLAQKYKTEPVPEKASVEDFKNVGKAFEQNAKYAEKTGAYRTAQTWRTFGTVLQNEVLVRGLDNMEQRLAKVEARVDVLLELPKEMPPTKRSDESHGVLTPKQQLVAGVKGAVLHEQRLVESSSNVATPIARPQQVPPSQAGRPAGGLPDPSHDGEELSLPPSLMGKRLEEMESASSRGGSKEVGKLLGALKPSLSGPTWYSSSDLEERKARIGDWRAPQRELLNFETPSKPSAFAIDIPPTMDRHNSDESFAMFSTSTDSKPNPSVSASFNSIGKHSMSSIPENMLPASSYRHYRRHDSDSGRDSQALTDGSYSNGSKVNQIALPSFSFYLFDFANNQQEDLFRAFGSPALPGTRAHPPFQNLHTADHLEASGTITPEDTTLRLEQSRDQSADILASLKAVAEYRDDTTPSLILGDFTLSPNMMLDEKSYPITAGKLLQQTFAYNTLQVPNPQHIFHLVALFKRFLPSSIAVQPYQREELEAAHIAKTTETLEDYTQYCKEELNLSTDEIHTILSDHLAHLVRFGISPWQAEAICLAYEEQLNRCLLFTSSTVVRNLLYSSFGAFREDNTMQSSAIGLVCIKCNKPINRPDRRCDSCGHRPDPCPVCKQKYSPWTVTKRARNLEELKVPAFKMNAHGKPMEFLLAPDDPTWTGEKHTSEIKVQILPELPVLWQFCLTCGHGAHAACLDHQQKIPELGGRCPYFACGCACVPGPYRDRIIREEEEERLKATAGSVKGDRKSLGESGAVKAARGLLGGEGGGMKSVRVVEPKK